MKKVPLLQAAIVVSVTSAFPQSAPLESAQSGPPTAGASNSRFAIILLEKSRPFGVNVNLSPRVFNHSSGQPRPDFAVASRRLYQDVSVASPEFG